MRVRDRRSDNLTIQIYEFAVPKRVKNSRKQSSFRPLARVAVEVSCAFRNGCVLDMSRKFAADARGASSDRSFPEGTYSASSIPSPDQTHQRPFSSQVQRHAI